MEGLCRPRHNGKPPEETPGSSPTGLRISLTAERTPWKPSWMTIMTPCLLICNADQHQRLAVGDAGRERIDVLDGVEPVAAAKRRRQRLHPPADAAKNAAGEQENRRAKQVDEFP